ncbi:MAG TPA: hypothetical protein VFS17_08450 [Methylophilaceae bacterium]|nr:hypothetical protein [Methylophilaceae bacterium]
MSCHRKLKWLIPALALLMLCGCVGGPLAQQLASSLLMHAADKAVASSIESNLQAQEEAERNKPLADKLPDEYWAAFVTSGFSQVTPIEQPLPSKTASTTEKPLSPQANQLVRVELWNLMLGEEKQSILEKARLMGASSVPPRDQWAKWKVATGASAQAKDKPLVFLIPPDFGSVSSGQQAVVELKGQGELNIARYPVN